MKKFIQLTTLITLAAMLSSCASIFNRTTKTVQVSSNPNGLSFEIKDRDAKIVQTGTTPASVRLSTRYGYFKGQSYTLTTRRGNAVIGTAKLDAQMSGWYIGNLLIGGVVGMLIIDPATGGMWTMPTSVTIGGSSLSSAVGDTALRVLALSEVPENLRAQLVRI